MSQPYRILLVDSQPYQHREGVLKAGNFEVSRVMTLADARAELAPGRFDLVLVVTESLDSDPLHFCESVKATDPTQLVALLTGPHVYIPQDSCPDDVIETSSGPRALIQRVARLIEPEPYFAD
jgi:DNA-binding response OmpR family regulator